MSNGNPPDLAAQLAETTRSLQEAIGEAEQYKALYEDAAMQSTALRRRVQELEERLARLGGGDTMSNTDGGSFGGPFALGEQGVDGEGNTASADVSLGLADPRRQVDHEHEQIRQMREMLQLQRQQQTQKQEEDAKALPAHIFSDEDRAALSSQIAALDGDEEAGGDVGEAPSDGVDASWSGASVPEASGLDGIEGDAMARYTAPANSQMDDDGAVNFDDYTDFSHDAPS